MLPLPFLRAGFLLTARPLPPPPPHAPSSMPGGRPEPCSSSGGGGGSSRPSAVPVWHLQSPAAAAVAAAAAAHDAPRPPGLHLEGAPLPSILESGATSPSSVNRSEGGASVASMGSDAGAGMSHSPGSDEAAGTGVWGAAGGEGAGPSPWLQRGIPPPPLHQLEESWHREFFVLDHASLRTASTMESSLSTTSTSGNTPAAHQQHIR